MLTISLNSYVAIILTSYHSPQGYGRATKMSVQKPCLRDNISVQNCSPWAKIMKQNPHLRANLVIWNQRENKNIFQEKKTNTHLLLFLIYLTKQFCFLSITTTNLPKWTTDIIWFCCSHSFLTICLL